MTDNELQRYTQLMKNRFMEDPGVIFQIKDLERAGLLIAAQFESQIQAFMEENAVRFLDGGKGLLIGYFTKEWPADRLMKVMQQSSQKLLAAATAEELMVLQDRAVKQSQIIPQDWHAGYCEGDVYHLLIVATDKVVKGTGAFRALITPVIEACESKKTAMVLETFNPDNLPIYEHFGFQVMESHRLEEMDLTCYCLMRSGD